MTLLCQRSPLMYIPAMKPGWHLGRPACGHEELRHGAYSAVEVVPTRKVWHAVRAAGAKGSRSYSTSAALRWAPTRSAHQATKKLQTNPTTRPLEVPGNPGEGPEPVGPPGPQAWA